MFDAIFENVTPVRRAFRHASASSRVKSAVASRSASANPSGFSLNRAANPRRTAGRDRAVARVELSASAAEMSPRRTRWAS